MDYLRQIEEDIRGLGAEAKKKYPEVKDATERALITLKTMREMYVADKMRKTGGDKIIKFPQSSDISAPYILACNYADANPKLLLIALSGIQMLVNYEVIPPGDVKNILRVFSIQAATGKAELQLKLLQILLQLANSLSQNATTSQYLTEATICSFLTLALQLSDGRNSTISVSSTAFATARQIIAIVMEGACGAFRNLEEVVGEDQSPYSSATPEKITENFCNSAQNLLKDITLFIQGKPGEMMRGMVVQPTLALDLLDDILVGWKDMFWSSATFRTILKQSIYAVLKPLLKSVQDDFANSVIKNGIAPASAFTSRVIRLARCFMLHFAMPELLDEMDVIITLMIHSLQPDRSLTLIDRAGLSFVDEASSMIGGAGSLISRLNIPGLSKPSVPQGTGMRPSSNSGLQSCYLVMSKAHSQNASSSTPMSQVLTHPAGACIEALISFFSSDVNSLMAQERGRQLLMSAITNAVLSVSAVICGSLAVDANVKEFDSVLRGSQLLSLVEGLFSGSDLNVDSVVRSIHEHLLTLSCITPSDLLIFSFALLQVVIRMVVRLTLAVLPRGDNFYTEILGGSHDTIVSVFVSKAAVISFQVDRGAALIPIFRDLITKSCISIVESIQESCIALLVNMDNSVIVRRALGMTAELAMVTGIFGLQQSSDTFISALCRFTVPAWHDHDLKPQMASEQQPSDVKQFRWRNIQAVVRLFQVVHILADVISDWDVIIDTIEQILEYISSNKFAFSDDVTASDRDKVFEATSRLKQYTVYLSDDSLIRLMTSLVAMSLNNLSSTGKKVTPGGRGRASDLRRSLTPGYLSDGIAAGAVNFSLQAAIEIAKYNSYRLSCVWQMVTSHLRMLATMKNEHIRTVAVAATHDMILTALDYMQTSTPPALPSVEHIGEFPIIPIKSAVTDEFLFNRLLPTFETCLLGGASHKNLLADRMKSNPMIPKLSQSDLLSSLKFLTSARHEDVLKGIVQGLLSMLQGEGEVVSGGGWNAIIDLIAIVPASMKPDEEDSSSDIVQEKLQWPIASLSTAFSCIKLIVDEFMNLVPIDAVVLVISCLASFASQIHDVNISLTSLEMLWKVYDQMMRDPKKDNLIAQSVFDVTMNSLFVSSMDQRPEIRHCAMNTLFAALTMTANASLTSGSQWKQVFDDVIFPLFQRAGDRSKQAAEMNEEAIAPELKKGKKMTLHHSRDTAHKQWSETRVLALKGLARVIKTCTWLLLQESWFRATWSYALEVCSVASQAAHVDQEVSLAGLDVMFTMLKVVSSNAYKGHIRTPAQMECKPELDISLDATLEISREMLWQLTWAAVNESAKFECQSPELALHICQSMSALYTSGIDAEFKYSENIRILCETVVLLARPRMSTSAVMETANARASKVAEVQLQRAVIELLRSIRPIDIVSLRSVISAFSEIAFASQYVQMPSPFSGEQIYFDSCPLKLRTDTADYFINAILNEQKTNDSEFITYTTLKGSHGVILEVVFRRFVNDLCESAMVLRNETVDFVRESPEESEEITIEEEGKSVVGGGFFSFLGGKTQQDGPSSSKAKRKAHLGGALHSLPVYIPPEKENINTWTTFYPVLSELNILVSTLECCSIHMSSNGQDDISGPLRQKIFSALLCIMSPWRVHELPAARNSHGSVISSDEEIFSKLSRLIDLILARGKLFGSSWITSLVNILSSSTRLMIHAICKEAEFMEFGGQAPKALTCILKLWSKVSKIFSYVITEVQNEGSRRRYDHLAQIILHHF